MLPVDRRGGLRARVRPSPSRPGRTASPSGGKHRLTRPAVAAWLLAVALLLGPPDAGADDAARTKERGISVVPVSFAVHNLNRSGLPCQSNGRRYRLFGRVIGPANLVGKRVVPATTVYVHEFSYGKFFWSFPQSPRYDYAAVQARAGHVSVVFDRLGYDGSPHPPGMATCLGAHADMVHQVVRALRTGRYDASPRRPIAFERVALAGHSIGGAISELSAYSFGGIDALVLMNWADQGFTPGAIRNGLEQGRRCAAGGQPAEPGTPSGYAHFIEPEPLFRFYQFYDAERAVADAVVARRNLDPCGDSMSLPSLAVSNAARVRSITVPVLIVFGRQSRSWDAAVAARQQRNLFAGSRDVKVKLIDRAAHALPFERTAPVTRRVVSAWLCSRLERDCEASPRDARGSDIRARGSCVSERVTMRGTAGGETIVGTSGDDVIAAGAGDDVITAGGGNDVVCGGSGHDRVAGGRGNDGLAGESGDDQLAGSHGRDTLSGGTGRDRCDGGAGFDRRAACES